MIDLTDIRRINFGCGYDKRPGYLNVDSDPACEPDVLLVDNDLSVLPKESFDEMLALDVLEHIGRVETLGVLLEWADLLVDQGALHLKTSSILGVAGQIRSTSSFREQFGWTLCLFGSQAHPGDYHQTGFTETTLMVHLIAAGFDVSRIWIEDHWLLHAEATKASSWSRIVSDSAALSDEEYIRHIYTHALDRDPDEQGLQFFMTEFEAGRLDRRAALRHLMASTERLFVVAHRHGFEPDGPRRVGLPGQQYIPEAWKPRLRSLSTSARSGSRRVRRALGSVKARRARI